MLYVQVEGEPKNYEQRLLMARASSRERQELRLIRTGFLPEDSSRQADLV